jgi:GT2 family glycosyltransferase
MPSLDIIIVNWNTGQQLRACLGSVSSASRSEFGLNRVVVVDNASNDGSTNTSRELGLPVTMIYNRINRGFAAGCNQGAHASQADYLLFLNPDARLFGDSLSKPLNFMEQPGNEGVGICGIQLIDDRGRISRTCARFPKPTHFLFKMVGLDRLFPRFFPSHFMTEWDHRESRLVDQVIGAFFLVRRSLFEALRGFDERYFVYWEDLDFSLRARQAGWRSVYLADAQAFHRGGGSSGQVRATRLLYALRSRILYGYKHFGWWPATGLMLGTLFLEPWMRLAFAAVRCSGEELMATVKGYLLLWSASPAFLKKVRLREVSGSSL